MNVNKIFCGDCLFVMRHDLLERGIKVDLIYLDPPFFTGKVQKGEVWHPEAMEISFDDSKRFWQKIHKSQIGNAWAKAPEWLKHIAVKRSEFASYLYYMMRRLEMCKRVLKDTGSIYLHCDERASHYLKMVMDEVFGVDNFKNEIVWCYKSRDATTRMFPRKHDIIFFYVKSKKYVFNSQYVPYRKEYVKGFFKLKDNDGRLYRIRNGKSEKKQYLDESKGDKLPDWWTDVKPLYVAIGNKERLGYPTQKPLALLERIIKASSNPMDVVLDPFCGCGTAIISAHRLGRRWVGIDVNSNGCRLMQKRFENTFNIKPEIHWRTEESLNNHLNKIKDVRLRGIEFEAWVNDFYNAKKPSLDKGVDGITKEGIPIQTKTYKVKYDVVSEFLTNIEFHPKLSKPVKQAIIVSQTGFEQSAISRAYQIERLKGIKIELVTPEKMLGGE